MKVQGAAHIRGFILAGGYGTRMQVLSDCKLNRFAVAKPALPIGIRSQVRQQLYLLHLMGLEHATVAVKFKPESVVTAIGDTSKFTLKVDVFNMNEQQVEDWGAAWTTYKWYSSLAQKPEKMVVLNGDILWDKKAVKPFMDYFGSSVAWADIMVAEMPLKDMFGRFGMVQIYELRGCHIRYVLACQKANGDHKLISQARMEYEQELRAKIEQIRFWHNSVNRFVEKPSEADFENHVSNLANVGVFGITKWLFDYFAPGSEAKKTLGQGFADFAFHLFQEGLIDGDCPFGAYIAPSNFYWKDVGTPLDLLQANLDLLGGRIDAGPQGEEVKPGVFIGKDCQIADSTLDKMEGPVIIGDNVYIGQGAVIKNSIVGSGWQIMPFCRIENSLLLPGFYGSKDNRRLVESNVNLNLVIACGGTIKSSDLSRVLSNVIFAVSPEGNTTVAYPYDFTSHIQP